MLDPEEFGQAMAGIVNEALEPLRKRIEELERREPPKGEDGKSVTTEDVAPMIAAEVAKAVAEIPPPKDGESVTVEDVAPLIAEQIKAAVDALPKPRDGRDATDEQVAKTVAKYLREHPPADGKSVTAQDVEPLIREEVAKAVSQIREPKDGVGVAGATIDRDGNLVLTLTNGEAKNLGRVVGTDGKDGSNGKDGAGLAGASINRDGELVLTLTNGEQKVLGRVVGEDGKDGADFSDVEIDYDGERTITIKGRGGEVTKRVPVPLDRGYWREGMLCEKSDIVTHGGSAWIALRETKAKPCLEAKEDWRLFARKGRDGKDGKHGIDRTKPAKLKKEDDDA